MLIGCGLGSQSLARYWRGAQTSLGRTGRGKRGGARVIYFVHSENLPLFLLTAYAKNARVELSAKERAELKALVKEFPISYERKKRR